MRAALSRALRAAAAAAVLASPRLALACSVCMSGRDDETRVAFLVTTVVLSLLPVAAVLGVALFLRRRARELDAASAVPPSASALSRTSSSP